MTSSSSDGTRGDGTQRDGFQRDRLLLVVAAVAAVVAAVIAFTTFMAPRDPSRYGPDFARRFTDACVRAGGSVQGCGCAQEALADELAFPAMAQVDEDLRTGGTVPAALAARLDRC